MSTKKSIMISDKSVRFIQARCKECDDIQWSQSMNNAIDELDYLYKALLPDFTEEQWFVILDAYQGVIIDTRTLPFRLASDIMDHYGVIDVSDLDEPQQGTVRAVYNLNQPEQMAVLDMVRRFWAADRSNTGESLKDTINTLTDQQKQR